MSEITQEQVIELEGNARFQNVVKQYVRDQATYLNSTDGLNGEFPFAGLSPLNWARQRFIAKGIVLHPNSQNYQEWVSQFSMLLKGQDLWATDANGTIDAMISTNKFIELAELTFITRSAAIEF